MYVRFKIIVNVICKISKVNVQVHFVFVGYGSQGRHAQKRYKTGNMGCDGWEM